MNCPDCNTPSGMQATVDGWLIPDGWQFYGETGKRWLRCRGAWGVHFLAELPGGKLQHRLAIFATKKPPKSHPLF